MTGYYPLRFPAETGSAAPTRVTGVSRETTVREGRKVSCGGAPERVQLMSTVSDGGFHVKHQDVAVSAP